MKIKFKLMQNKNSLLSTVDRLKAPTPPFFKKLSNILISVGAICGAVLLTPITLPALVTTILGYGIAVGAVGATISKLAVDWSKIPGNDNQTNP